MIYGLVLFTLLLSSHEDTGWNSGFCSCSWKKEAVLVFLVED